MEKYMYVIYFLFLEMFAKGLSRNISNKEICSKWS